jgi:uncharacterized membrane protein
MLFLHILGAATWFGASLTIFIVVPRMRAAGHKAAGPFMGVYEKTSNMIYAPAAVLLLVTGVWLVIDSSFWDWDQAFVSIGFAAVIAGVALGVLVFAPAVRKLRAAHEASDDAALPALYSRFMAFAALDLAIVTFAIIAMVWKMGA